MNIYEKVSVNILYYMNKLQNDDAFKNQYPNITVEEYLVTKTKIKPKRLSNILTDKGKAKIDEIYAISLALNVKLSDIITYEVKHIDS